MVGTDFFRTFKGLSEVKLYGIKDSLVYNLPVPLDLSIDNGIQERRIPTRNAFGEQVFSDSFVVARDAVLRVVFPVLTPEILELKTERQFTQVTDLEYSVAKTIDPTYFPVVNTDYEIDLTEIVGSGVTIIGAEASTTTGNLSTSIPVTVTTNKIKIPVTTGQNNENVSLLIKCKDTVLAMGQKLDGFYKLFATMVTTENQLVVLTAPKVKPSFQGSSFSPSMEQIDTIFYMQTPSGQTKAYDIIYTDKIVNV